jgi:uncharacterized membrane protein
MPLCGTWDSPRVRVHRLYNIKAHQIKKLQSKQSELGQIIGMGYNYSEYYPYIKEKKKVDMELDELYDDLNTLQNQLSLL